MNYNRLNHFGVQACRTRTRLTRPRNGFIGPKKAPPVESVEEAKQGSKNIDFSRV